MVNMRYLILAIIPRSNGCNAGLFQSQVDDHERDDYDTRHEDALTCLVLLMEEDVNEKGLANSKCASKDASSYQ